MLTDAEREQLCTHLRRSARQFRQALANLTPAQWTFAPGDGAWPVAGIAEHLVLIETSVLEKVRSTFDLWPAASEEQRARAPHKDRILLERVPVRGVKAQAPPHAQPQGRWTAATEAEAAFDGIRGETIAYALSTAADLRGRVAEHPALKLLDGYQWLLLWRATRSATSRKWRK